MRIRHLYQPVVNIVTGQIIGYEALLRGAHYEGPGDVLAAAKRQGRLLEVDARSFRMAAAGAPPGITFVNVLPATLVRMAADGRSFTKGTGTVRPKDVCIEVVEVAGLRDMFARFLATVEAVRAAGYLLAVDDISSGNDRLRLVAELAPEFVKIDRHLVERCHENQNRLHTIHRVLQLAGDLGARVIAEGIETGDERAALEHIGVTYGQGFLLGPGGIPGKRLSRGECGG